MSISPGCPQARPCGPTSSRTALVLVGGTATKQLGRWCRQVVGIEDPRKVLHSARHRFKDVCRAAGIAKDVHDALTGHTAGDVGSTYGLGHNLATLREAVDRLPVIDLSCST